jgi:CRISPR-associated endoribonuclease Cas6
MRLTFRFFKEGVLRIPINYNQIIQGIIYDNLEKELAEFVHERGYRFEKRSFKLFTFSRILGKTRIRDGYIEVFSPFKLVVSSPKEDILCSLAENLVRMGEVHFGEENAYLEAVNVHFAPLIDRSITIKMLSPVTIYSTLSKADGSKKTYYYSPFEEEFSFLLKKNILKKYHAAYGRAPCSDDFRIEPLRVRRHDEKIVVYKGFIIKGWMGHYRLSGNPELLKLAYEAGLGGKNPQGFGCFELLEAF